MNSVRRLVSLVPLIVLSQDAESYDSYWLTNPPAQVDGQTCQSYALSIALAALDPSPILATFSWRIDNVEELRLSEAAFRAEIVSAMKARNPDATLSERVDWDIALKHLTLGQYKRKEETFASVEELWKFLSKNAVLNARAKVASPLTLSTPFTVYLLSVRRVGGNAYSNGHIVGVLGIDLVASEAASPGDVPALLMINSAVRQDANVCSPELSTDRKYAGATGWTADYEIKVFEGRYRLDWIVPATE